MLHEYTVVMIHEWAMESSHVLRMALIKIRLMADISRDAQFRADEFHMVLDMISELTDSLLEEEEKQKCPLV